MIDNILKAIQHIPAFPMTILKVSELLRNEDYSVDEVVNLIKYDQALAANALKMCNSVYFSARQKISTVRDAVLFLGQNNLIRVVQTAGISRFFHKTGISGYTARVNELWEHAVAVAIMSQILARKIMKSENEKLYLAALLHDVGKMVMGEYVYESFDKIMSLVVTGKYSFLEAEKEIIGIDHAAVGGKIATYWNFPEEMVFAIEYHHRPDLLEKNTHKIAWLVYLADQICLLMGITGGMDDLAHRGVKEVMELFDFHEKDLELGMIQLEEDLKYAKDILNIV